MNRSAFRFKLIVALVIFLGITSSIIPISLYFGEGISKDRHVLYWIQVFSGNWSAESRPEDMDDTTFSISSLGAVALNIGNFAAVLTFLATIWGLSKRLGNIQERLMMLSDIYSGRDLSIKNEILNLLPLDRRRELAPILERGFKQGNEVWNEVHLPNILGEEGAQRVRKELSEIEVKYKEKN